MTKSVQRRNSQKRLRRKAKPHTPYAQSPGYWRREIRNRDKVKDEDCDTR